MMLKIKTDKKENNRLGGLNPIAHHIKKLGIQELIDSHLGKRVKQAKYSKGETLIYWMLGMMGGADKLDRITKKHGDLKQVTTLNEKTPSRYTISRVMKSITTSTSFRNDQHKSKNLNEINLNRPMNSLLVELICKLKLLKKNVKYTLDVDTMFLKTNARDSKFGFNKEDRGYNPCVSVINGIGVYFEMRNGNVNPKYKLLDHIKNTINELKKHGIKIGTVRIDRAGFNHKIFEYLNKHKIKFFVRALSSKILRKEVELCSTWREVEMERTDGYTQTKVASIDYLMHKTTEFYRVVAARSGKSESESLVITNDFEMKEEDVFYTYEARAAEERVFDNLKNNYGWKYPPFSDMNHNTVFFIISLMCLAIYKYTIEKFSKITEKLKSTFWLKRFRELFIRVSVVWDKEKDELTFSKNGFNYLHFFR